MIPEATNFYQSHQIETIITYYEKLGYRRFEIQRLDNGWYKIYPIQHIAKENIREHKPSE